MPTVKAEVASYPDRITEVGEDEKYQHLTDACNKYAKNPSSCFKIMRGVFKADSGFCKNGVAARTNNCGNMRPGTGKYGDKTINWTSYPVLGNGYFRQYATIKDGIYDNVALYSQLYEGTSVEYMRNVWAHAGQNWANTVYQSINTN